MSQIIIKKIKKYVSTFMIMILCLSFCNCSTFAEDKKNSIQLKNENLSSTIEDAIKNYLNKKNDNSYQAISQNTFHPGENDFFYLENVKNPIYKVIVHPDDTKRKNKLSLTFDSAYINNYTYQILDILDEHDAKATFFMTADWASKNPEHVLEIVRRGHEIGNHTYKHPDFKNCSNEKIINEIMTMHNLIKELFDIDMCLFRFPYGSYTQVAMDILKIHGYYPIQWSNDSLDWKDDSPEMILYRIQHMTDIGEGSIVLFHNGAKYTPQVLPYVFAILEQKGLKSVKVSDLIYKHNFYVASGNQHPIPDENGNFVFD